jgi:hypothetical protein
MPIYPTSVTGSEISAVSGGILSNYVYGDGLHDPEYSKILTYKYPQYYMTALLDKLGATEGIAQDRWSWSIMDRTREGGTASSVSATGSTTITFEVTEFDYTSAKPGYLIVGDVVRFQSGAEGVVTVVAASSVLSDKQKVTVRKVGGGNWAAADIADGDVFGHTHTMFSEGSSAPSYRIYLPSEESNALTTLRRSLKISGSEFTNRTILGDGKSWYFTVEDIEMKEFRRDQENAIIFGKYEADTTNGIKSTRGLFTYVDTYGVKNGFVGSSGVQEADIQNQIKEMMLQNCSDTLTVLAGADFASDFQIAMKPYYLNGGVEYGRFGKQMVGLDTEAYRFMGKTVYLKYYTPFDDTAVLPYSGSANSVDYNFSNLSLWLDLGSDEAGRKLINMKHKELDGVSRKFIHAWEPGMVSPTGVVGGQVANGDDSFKVHYLSEIGIEVRLANRMGILKATS